MAEKMKQNHIPIIIIITLILGIFLMSCFETVNVSTAERDKAVIFYKKLYPLTAEFKQINDEWDEWNVQANQTKYESQIITKYEHFEANLIVLASKVGALEAPPNLVYLQNSTFSAINSRSKFFALLKQHALTGNERYYIKAELTLSESMKLEKQAANAYDEGLIKYGIKPFETTD